MMGRMALAALALLSVLSALSTLAQAQQQPSAPPSSTFYIPETETQFSLNIANDSDAGDIYLYLTSPAYSWVGFGFGQGMKDSLMFIVYPSKDGKNATVSPRIATGNSEPSAAPGVSLETLPGTGITDDMFIVKAVCHYCRAWLHGTLDVTSTSHPMIYAFGPGNRLQSDALDAPLRRHYKYGRFTMDLVSATGTGGVPVPEKEMRGAQQVDGGLKRDRDRKALAHAVIGCLALFVAWPLNVVVASFFKGLKWHLGVSAFVMGLLVITFGLGIASSGQYHRTKDYRSPHQVLALLAIAPLLLISILPARPIATLTPLIPRLHAPLTTISLTILTLSGGLGLHLTSQARPFILAYSAIALLVFAFCLLLQTCVARRGSARARQRRRDLGEEPNDSVQRLVLKQYWTGKSGGSSPSEAATSRSGSAASGRYSPYFKDHKNPYSQSNSPSRQGHYSTTNYTAYDSQHQQSSHPQPQGLGVYTQGHTRGGSQNGSRTNIYGGGTMPGPQYLLNMHPGVPVHFGK